MNCLNLIKITPLLLSNLIGINKAKIIEPYKFISLACQIETENEYEYFVSRLSPNQNDWPIDLEYIQYETYGGDFNEKLTESNYTNGIKFDIATTDDILYIAFKFSENVNINNVNLKKDNIDLDITKQENTNICFFNINMAELEPNKWIDYSIYIAFYTPPTPPPQYIDYTSYEIPQSNLNTFRYDNKFNSYSDNERFNRIEINKDYLSIYINKSNQFAKILYSNKYIYLPILGTFFENNIQYNIVDIYFTNGSTLINMLNNKLGFNFFRSLTRTQQQSNYLYKNCIFNQFSPSKEKYDLDYTKTSSNNIEITTNDVGMGNNGYATITNKEKEITTMEMYSIFGINPKTTSYFGGDNPTRINQFKSGGSISAPIYQIVEMTNYNEYLQMYTYRNDTEQELGELTTALSNMDSYNDLKINVIAFKTNTQSNPELAINDITTLFSTLDNLEGLGFFPFTFGTIIFIGVVIGFIMVLVKVLK